MTNTSNTVRGRGAWTTYGKDNGSKYYCYLRRTDPDGAFPELDQAHLAVNRGVLAIQTRLDQLGYRHPVRGRLNLDGVFKGRTMRAVKWFQRNEGLAVDGVFGPKTANTMWKTMVRESNTTRPDLLWGLMQLESAGDPGAVSSLYNPENGPDFGLCQINLHFNPDVTRDLAFNVNFALAWSAARLEQTLREFSGKGSTLQANCVVAYHNSPVRATEWYRTGQPPNEQIAEYARLVLSRAATF